MLTCPQAIKEFPTFNGNRKVYFRIYNARHLSHPEKDLSVHVCTLVHLVS
jgi:hypothetical protein